MSVGLRSLRVPLALAILAAGAVAHDQPLTVKQQEELASARKKLGGALQLEDVQALRKILSSFTVSDLHELTHHPEIEDLPAQEETNLRHAIWAITFVDRHDDDLADPWAIAILLGSPRWHDWLEAQRQLEKEEYGHGLERVASTLVMDPRPQVRLIAGRLAKGLTRFRGSSPTCRAIAVRLLRDPVPNVVAMFGAFDAHDFMDKDVTDLAVARVRDRRELQAVPGATPAWGGTVSEWITPRLYGEMLHRHAGEALGGSQERAADAVELWWKQNRDRYDYGPDPARWVFAGEWRGKCAEGREVEVPLGAESLWFELLDFSEDWVGDRPVHTATVRFRAAGQAAKDAPCIGSRDVEGLSRACTSFAVAEAGAWQVEYVIAQGPEGHFRVCMRAWSKREK